MLQQLEAEAAEAEAAREPDSWQLDTLAHEGFTSGVCAASFAADDEVAAAWWGGAAAE
jgi:hypothetical protein